ncbi:hypothetical protein NQ314_003082 [Rhamnusium bicolor]|uniref:Uncharacterized protein n=1 Tax=Rhamnusium bicolor TaxID=1586634 RepID=A0AAV8ZNC0_9CUCU|nr:hypothetical protein NQ314_003082 [Rhamnusium bicolor]
MEKKGNRNLPASKGTATDSKKDGVSSRLWPRGGRRREPAGSSLSTKNETSRKPQPQRVKTIDKRPKPRGVYNSGAVGRTETARLEENEAELGSVFLPGSKKQSLNHLLNFSYAPYTPRDGFQPERGHNKGGAGNRMLTTKKHKYNKEHFLQANAIAVPHSTFNVTETITFKLMKRPRGCLTAYPADAEVNHDNIIFNMSDQKAREVYSKLLLAKKRDILSIIARESEELQEQLAENDNCPKNVLLSML